MALIERKIRAGKTEDITNVETTLVPCRSADILDLSDPLKRSRRRGEAEPGARERLTILTKPKKKAPARLRRRANRAGAKSPRCVTIGDRRR